MYLLDTDHLVVLQSRSEPDWSRLRQRMGRYAQADFHLSVVSFHEQVLGANAFVARAKRRADLVRGYEMMEQAFVDFSRFEVLPFDDSAAIMFEQFRAQRVRIGTMDLRIASVAVCQGKIVLSRNLADYRQVPGLSVEDWTGE